MPVSIHVWIHKEIMLIFIMLISATDIKALDTNETKADYVKQAY